MLFGIYPGFKDGALAKAAVSEDAGLGGKLYGGIKTAFDPIRSGAWGSGVGLGDGSLLSPAFKQAAYLSLGTELMNKKMLNVVAFSAPGQIGKEINQVEAQSNAPIADQAVPPPAPMDTSAGAPNTASTDQGGSQSTGTGTDNTNNPQASPLTQGTPGLG